MRYLFPLLAAVLLPTASHAADISLSPFASSNCPGLTFYTDFKNGIDGWNYGGNNDLSDGNGQFASHQASGPSPAVTHGQNGLHVGVVQTDRSLEGAMLNTQNQFYQQYGYFEMVASLDAGALSPGVTTAFWLMSQLGGWPPEIDIQETSGNTGDTAVHAHGGTSGVSYQPNMQPGTHVWAVDWNKEKITFYYDGEIPTDFSGTQAITQTPPEFHVPMYMILDAFSHGNTGTMNIKTIRVFKDMQSALACVPSAVLPTTSIVERPPTLRDPETEPKPERRFQPQVPPILAQAGTPMPSMAMPNLTDPSTLSAEIAATQRQLEQAQRDLDTLPALIERSRSQQTMSSSTELTDQAPPPTKHKHNDDDEDDR